jgi:phenylacetic acid degradation operon negative regulatory protein
MLTTIVETILAYLTEDARPYPRPFESPYKFIKRFRKFEKQQYYNTVWKMRKRGLIKVVEKNGQKFLKCTKSGQLEILMKKATIQKTRPWDGKWRLVIFDIPESSREKRNQLRQLLKKNYFYKLQASVFINPYPLNRETIKYLKETSLIDYIRIIRADEIDDDKKLKQKFGLP